MHSIRIRCTSLELVGGRSCEALQTISRFDGGWLWIDTTKRCTQDRYLFRKYPGRIETDAIKKLLEEAYHGRFVRHKKENMRDAKKQNKFGGYESVRAP